MCFGKCWTCEAHICNVVPFNMFVVLESSVAYIPDLMISLSLELNLLLNNISFLLELDSYLAFYWWICMKLTPRAFVNGITLLDGIRSLGKMTSLESYVWIVLTCIRQFGICLIEKPFWPCVSYYSMHIYWNIGIHSRILKVKEIW